MNVKFANRVVGDGNPCFVTYEAGPTHDGVETAKALISLAAEAGADAIKFQILDPDRLVSDRELQFSYDVLVNRKTGETETIHESLHKILCRRCLTQSEWREVKTHADKVGLAFFATVTFEDELDFVVSLGCQSIKIASADINHIPFLRKAAQTGLCIQLDTGSASIGEIEVAIDSIRAEGNDNIIIHHCPSGYPAHLEGINLNVISTLKKLFPYPVAFSDHTPGWEMDIAAVALGANLVEKTITFDRMTKSVEHIMSLEPSDMKSFVKSIRDIEIAMGISRRILHPREIEKRKSIRRSTWIVKGGKKGEKLGDLVIDFRRPGFGIGPDLFDEFRNASLKNDVPENHLLSFSDLDLS